MANDVSVCKETPQKNSEFMTKNPRRAAGLCDGLNIADFALIVILSRLARPGTALQTMLLSWSWNNRIHQNYVLHLYALANKEG